MKDLLTTRNKIIAGVALFVLILGCALSYVSSTGKKTAQAFYSDLKETLSLDTVLSEGDVSYSMFSGNLSIANPEVRAVPEQTGSAESFFQGIMNMVAGGSRDVETGLGAWANYQISSAVGKNAGGIFAKAEEIQIGRSGDKESGDIRIKVIGLDMSNPYLASKGGDVVFVADVGDVIQPRAEMQEGGRVTEGNSYQWFNNMASQARFNGGWIVNSTGVFGSKVDMDLIITRESGGEGVLTFFVKHKNGNSTLGTITRKVEFTSMPDLDSMIALGRSSMSAFAVGSMSARGGVGVMGQALQAFMAKAKVKTYTLVYDGFDQFGEDFKEFKTATGQEDYAAYCNAYGLSKWSLMSESKAKHDDSECAIAQKLISKGTYEEDFKFDDTKSLFADLFVSSKFEFSTN